MKVVIKNAMYSFASAAIILLVIAFFGPLIFGGPWGFFSQARTSLINLFGDIIILRIIAAIAAAYIFYLIFTSLKRIRVR